MLLILASSLVVAPKLLSAGEPASSAKQMTERGLETHETFSDCHVCPEMVVVPAGTLMMGSPPTEEGRASDEGPQHSVTIATPFAIGKVEVTVGEFAAFVQATGYDAGSECFAFEDNRWIRKNGWSWRKSGFAQTGMHPATCLNWNDANAYLEWLSHTTGKQYRLPSEAEWEYAARAGTRTRYHFGDDEEGLCRYGNGADQAAQKTFSGLTAASCSDAYDYTSPAASFAANAFGIHDMHGNVFEWVEDCYKDDYQGIPVDGSAWTAGDCARRVVRGGAWFSPPRHLRAASRGWFVPRNRGNGIGLRAVRTLGP